jgi:hypothetical protein
VTKVRQLKAKGMGASEIAKALKIGRASVCWKRSKALYPILANGLEKTQYFGFVLQMIQPTRNLILVTQPTRVLPVVDQSDGEFRVSSKA